MPADETPPPGGFDFEQFRKLLEQLGLSGAVGDLDLNQLLAQFSQLQSAGVGFGLTGADKDPAAAWLTTVTAAKQLVNSASPDQPLSDSERSAIADAERLAQSWLSTTISFSETGLPPEALRREQWLDETSAGWRELVEPIINGLADAIQRGTNLDNDPELSGLTAALAPMMRPWASRIYRERLVRVLAELASSTLSGTEIGINLLPRARVAILPSNLAEFTRDLELPQSDLLLHLVLREAARTRLFHHVGWLSPQLTALLAHFAREIRIDFEAISAQFDNSLSEEISLEEIMAVGEQVRGSFFKPASTELQLEILARLELLLALIEGWVDHVTARAAAQWMPNTAQLDEVIRRRRASAGPAQSVFADLLGLNLRPRLVRDAENLWAAVEHERGAAGRDAIWQHPDLLPTQAQLTDPLAFAASAKPVREADPLDAELRKLLGEA